MSFISNDTALSATPFDPLTYINSTFTSSASLDADLAAFSSSLNQEILKLDKSISSSIQSQSTASKTAREDIKQAQQASLQLRSKIEVRMGKNRSISDPQSTRPLATRYARRRHRA